MIRRPIPNRRPQVTTEIEFRGNRYLVSFGNDGATPEPLEVFVTTMNKAGTSLEDAVRDSAILISLAIQHGCPIETMHSALTRDEDGGPASVIGAVVNVMREVA